jgi:hypothetical protein
MLLETRITLVLLYAMASPPSDGFSMPLSIGRYRRPPHRLRPRSCTATTSMNPFYNHSVASSTSSSSVPHSHTDSSSPSALLLSGNRMAMQSSDEDDPRDDDVLFLDVGSRCVEAGRIRHRPPHDDDIPSSPPSHAEALLSTYVGPRFVLALVAVLYGTNFPLGAIMNDNLPASAATSSRMVLASIVLSPFLARLRPNLVRRVLLGGAFVSLGYISQSVALIDTSPALVSFLGSATVLVCPALQWLVDGRPMGMRDAPQTWLVRSIFIYISLWTCCMNVSPPIPSNIDLNVS